MTNDNGNVLHLNQDRAQMRRTLENLLRRCDSGELLSLAVCGELMLENEPHIISGAMLGDESNIFTLIGIMSVQKRRIEDCVE